MQHAPTTDGEAPFLWPVAAWTLSTSSTQQFIKFFFNNLPKAFLTILQIITLEGWIGITHIYDYLLSPLFEGFFFLQCIIICSFFVANLTIAVILIKYKEYDKSERTSTNVKDDQQERPEISVEEPIRVQSNRFY